MEITKSIIFWDWNGTLLNDAIACVEAMNVMLKQRQKSVINLQYYKSVFGFPVKDYYEELGFNFQQESFEDLSKEFISNYNKYLHMAKLHDNAIEILEFYRKQGKKQVVISAMEHKMLKHQLSEYGVDCYFNDVRGINNIYAKDKTHLAEAYMNEYNVNSNDVVFIGDTLHDKEVADEIGVETILMSNGHQSEERLLLNGNKVYHKLSSLFNAN